MTATYRPTCASRVGSTAPTTGCMTIWGGARRSPPTACPNARVENPAAARDAFAAAFPRAHMEFLDACALKIRIGSYLFVHAGIRPGVPLPEQTRDDLIWIREPFLGSDADFGFKVVHGHTIVGQVEHWPNRIAVDTGAVRTGVLSCLVLEGTQVSLLQPSGLTPWPEGSGIEAPEPPRNAVAEPLAEALNRGLGPCIGARADVFDAPRMPAPRGVAQLVEHRSPKPRVVGSKSYRPCQHADRGDFRPRLRPAMPAGRGGGGSPRPPRSRSRWRRRG